MNGAWARHWHNMASLNFKRKKEERIRGHQRATNTMCDNLMNYCRLKWPKSRGHSGRNRETEGEAEMWLNLRKKLIKSCQARLTLTDRVGPKEAGFKPSSPVFHNLLPSITLILRRVTAKPGVMDERFCEKEHCRAPGPWCVYCGLNHRRKVASLMWSTVSGRPRSRVAVADSAETRRQVPAYNCFFASSLYRMNCSCPKRIDPSR